MPHMNLDRAREEMQKRGLQGLIVHTAPNFYYSTGFRVPLGGRPNIAIVPADPGMEPALLTATFNERVARQASYVRDIRSYPIWIEIVEARDIEEGKVKRTEKPSQFDLSEIYKRLASILREKGLQEGRVGIEKEAYTLQHYSLLVEHNPRMQFVDAESLFWELRTLKGGEEIEVLRSAAQITEMGIQAMMRGGADGVTIGELQRRYKTGIMGGISCANALGYESSRAMISAGDHFQSVNRAESKVCAGQSIYIDCGITLEGYVSDMGRTFSVGKAGESQKRIFAALHAGYEAALQRLGPGVKMRQVFEVAVDTVRKSGLDWYTRGHMGHTMGLAPGAEQPPFISATEERTFEPNMVICLEAPLYVSGLGAFQIEDEILITGNGYECLTTLPREMVAI